MVALFLVLLVLALASAAVILRARPQNSSSP